MHHRTRARLAAALLAFASATATAQQVAIDDLARRSEVNEVSLSPTGEYVALAVPTADGMETQLQILKLDGSGDTQVLRLARQQHVTGIIWTGDEQLVVSRAKMEPLLARPYSLGELLTSDVRGDKQEMLFGYVPDNGNKRGRRKDEGFASIARVLNSEPGHALVEFECWNCGEDPDTVIFKVDTTTGERKEVERADGLASFAFDQTGEARLRTSWDDNDDPVLYYRPAKGADWAPLPKSIAGRQLYGARFDTDNNTVYALVSDKGEPAQLYRIDLAAGTRTKLAGRDDIAVSYLMYAGRDGMPFAAVYDAASPTIQYVDPKSEWAQLHAGLLKSFPGQMLTLNSFSRDGNKVLFGVWSDRNPGSYYVYDRAAKRASKIVDFSPWLKPERLAQARPLEFKARDGSKLFGFYTAPAGNGPRPLIVMPHGGPFGPYDQWGYDSDAQFFASRGYGVLQVNFRGSGGRGETFQRAAWKQWGGLIQDDIADGVKYAIGAGLADASRICIYGASFGGYSALMNPIRNPGMYKCAIGYVGVYDLELLRKTDGTTHSKRGRRFLDRQVGTEEAMLQATSPAQQVAKIGVPVMLVHGSADATAKFDQYRAMERALKAAGHPYETMVVEGEGHGFYKPENRAELYRRMEAFLHKHLDAGAGAEQASR